MDFNFVSSVPAAARACDPLDSFAHHSRGVEEEEEVRGHRGHISGHRGPGISAYRRTLVLISTASTHSAGAWLLIGPPHKTPTGEDGFVTAVGVSDHGPAAIGRGQSLRQQQQNQQQQQQQTSSNKTKKQAATKPTTRRKRAWNSILTKELSTAQLS